MATLVRTELPDEIKQGGQTILEMLLDMISTDPAPYVQCCSILNLKAYSAEEPHVPFFIRFWVIIAVLQEGVVHSSHFWVISHFIFGSFLLPTIFSWRKNEPKMK